MHGRQGKGFAFTLSDSGTELLHVSYSAENHAFITDRKEIALQPGDLATLHALVDGSVIETILGERIGYTKRFYYTGRPAPDIGSRADKNHVKMSAWKAAPISPNRLTTPAHTA